MNATTPIEPTAQKPKDNVRLFCFGSPLADFRQTVEPEFLQKYNLNKDEACIADEYSRKVFHEIQGRADVGGSVTNTVRIVKALIRGNTVRYFGTIGDDENGRMITRVLRAGRLESDLTVVAGCTGRVAVLLCEGSRTLVTDLAVARIFNLNEKIYHEISNYESLIYLSGFFVRVSPQTITRLIATKRPIAFNLGAAFLPAKFRGEMTQLYLNSSIVFGNESEHRAFAKIHDITSSNLVDLVMATNQLLAKESRVVVVTRARAPVLTIRGCDWREFEVPPASVVDTNGAGDAFVGGFLACYVGGADIADCVNCGIRVAHKLLDFDYNLTYIHYRCLKRIYDNAPTLMLG